MAYFVKGNMNQDHYKTMNGPGPVEEVFSGTGKLIFMRDGALYHKGRYVAQLPA